MPRLPRDDPSGSPICVTLLAVAMPKCRSYSCRARGSSSWLYTASRRSMNCDGGQQLYVSGNEAHEPSVPRPRCEGRACPRRYACERGESSQAVSEGLKGEIDWTYAYGATAQSSVSGDPLQGHGVRPDELELLVEVHHVLLERLEVVTLLFVRRERLTAQKSMTIQLPARQDSRIRRRKTDIQRLSGIATRLPLRLALRRGSSASLG